MPPKKPAAPTQTATTERPGDTTHTLAVSALQFGNATLSPAQKRFNQLLKQTETLAQKITDTRQLADAHRLVMHQTLAPLEKQYNVLIRDMALWLDGRLQRKGLNAKQKNAAIETLLHMAAVLARAGDTAMAELFDKYSDANGRDGQRQIGGAHHPAQRPGGSAHARTLRSGTANDHSAEIAHVQHPQPRRAAPPPERS
ncbi:hypothetical protein [Rhodoferax sp.]|uniref:hypothetical protein n=1 Tax=Rhodoferax sp. TaxID=50421 RepID=UPI002635F6C8|nr:hypothetical protein [Rhodoferax sp.]MDD2808331.1 hypothetical protein [Rhodoferax sp.]MDD4942942.1 hypothetical protein [Rhodoferax sp.]